PTHRDLPSFPTRRSSDLTQIVAHATEQASAHTALKDVRNEWVLQVKGLVRARKEGTKNPKLATGDIEVAAGEVTVLNESKTPPLDRKSTRLNSSHDQISY